jgi:hypothetical protein
VDHIGLSLIIAGFYALMVAAARRWANADRTLNQAE